MQNNNYCISFCNQKCTLAAAGMRCTLMTVPLAEADASSVPS